MDNKNLLILGLIGVGIYLYYKRNKVNQPVIVNNINPAAPVNDTGAQRVDSTGVELPQTLDYRTGSPDIYNVRFAINGYKKKLGQIPNTI